jgi:hypothetical protein
VEEDVDLVPPERLPTRHVTAPVLRPDSEITITLDRSLGLDAPSYTVTLTTKGIVFDGEDNVAAEGRHTANVDANAVRRIAQKFIDADFYSMDDRYVRKAFDAPTIILSISIDGRTKKVIDDVGLEDGMPVVVRELQEDVDALAQTDRWIVGH